MRRHQPALFAGDFQIQKDHQRHGDGKAQEPDRQEKAHSPGNYGEGSLPDHCRGDFDFGFFAGVSSDVFLCVPPRSSRQLQES